MRFKHTEALPIITTGDVYFDLFNGGDIEPHEMLETEDALKVTQAMSVIVGFVESAIDGGYIEEI